MSSFISGSGGACRLDLELIKSPSSSWISNSSSTSSTLSESPHTVSTRKPRTPRKRPNQTYNEAAVILSTAHPKIFPIKSLTKPCKFTKLLKNPFFEPSELLIPFQVNDCSGYLVNPRIPIERKGFDGIEKQCLSPGEISSHGKSISSEICDEGEENLDVETILDEEIDSGIDGIVGKLSIENEPIQDSKPCMQMDTCYGYPLGLGFGFGFGNVMRSEDRAMRNDDDDGDWWRFPSVDVLDITQKIAKIPVEKKMKKQVEKKKSVLSKEYSQNKNVVSQASGEEESSSRQNGGLLLTLNYDAVSDAWADRGSPFSGGAPVTESAGDNVRARLAQIDLFPIEDGVVLRSKGKHRTRGASKKVRCQLPEVDADHRPRVKGRFVSKPKSPDDEGQ